MHEWVDTPAPSWCLLFFLQAHWNSQMWRETALFSRAGYWPLCPQLLSAIAELAGRCWGKHKGLWWSSAQSQAQSVAMLDILAGPGALSFFICKISNLDDTAFRFSFSFHIPWFVLLNKPDVFNTNKNHRRSFILQHHVENCITAGVGVYMED